MQLRHMFKAIVQAKYSDKGNNENSLIFDHKAIGQGIANRKVDPPHLGFAVVPKNDTTIITD